MADLHIEVNDGVTGNEKIGGEISTPPRASYTVTSPSGINKNGQHYATGSQVQLDEQTARNFAATGDISMGEQSNG